MEPQQPHPGLSSVLDNDEDMKIDSDGNQDLAQSLAEQQMLREHAEAQLKDKEDRLRVAQEQLAEWAQQKQQDTQQLLHQAESLHALIQASSAAAHAPAELQQQLAALSEKLREHAAEAEAFAVQQKADVESLKRSSQQAGMSTDEDSTDSKRRQRDGAQQQHHNGGGSNGHHSKEEDEATCTDSDDEEGDEVDGDDEQQRMMSTTAPGGLAVSAGSTWAERAKFIPMRLEQEQRRLLRLLEAALNVSQYTDKVDILVWRNKAARIHTQIKDLCAILSGLVVAQDYRLGQQLIKDRGFAENAEFFQEVFEVGRRYKIMNPDKMRSEWGKLMYMLMDSAHPEVQELLEFRCVRPLLTVARFLEERGGARLLQDPLMQVATAEIMTGERTRYEIQRDIKAKERAREVLAKRYANAHLTQEQVLAAIYSFSDNNTYLLYNRDPIDRMLTYFKAYFKPAITDPEFSLAIQGGKGGARLTHSHERQYHYVLQSLTLWREISTDMFKLWYLAETDMLREGNSYRLCDTGQGLNRVQAAPSLSRAMQGILARCQSLIGSWVGSSVVHLGDHNVPNALMFIDKYTQVPRILNPVVSVLDQLPKLADKDPQIAKYIDSAFGGVEECRQVIMTDFCRHAFDGSGADNFFDAGSCIDGRLTSAWNWCSKLEKKSYYPVFKLAGFTGFDGDFK